MSDEYLKNPKSALSSFATLLCLPQLPLTIIVSACSLGGREVSAKTGQRTENRANGQIIFLCCV